MASNTTSSFDSYTAQQPPRLISGISDDHLSLLLPVVCHWVFSAFFEMLDQTGWLGQYRMHTSEEELKKNRVTKWECFRATVLGQVLQTLLAVGLGALGGGDVVSAEEYGPDVWIGRVHAVIAAIPRVLSLSGIDFETMATTSSKARYFPVALGHSRLHNNSLEVAIGGLLYWYIVPMFQLAAALIVADAGMYFFHRLGHTRWLYKHFHSQHHRLYVPYSWGAGYNHPFDSLVTDGCSYGFGCWAAGLSTRMVIILLAYSTFKNVSDHCGYEFPWNPIKTITGTDPNWHDVHHQSWGLKTNYGAHLAIWDHMMGTAFTDHEKIERLRSRDRVATGSRKTN